MNQLTQIGEPYVVKSNRVALYQCACGKQKALRMTHVRNGKVRSCGCLAKAARETIKRREWVSQEAKA